MFNSKVGAVLCSVLAMAALAFPTVAAAQSSTFVVVFDRSGAPGIDGAGNATGAFFNPCTGQYVDVFGSSTISTSQRLGNNGIITTNVSVSTKGTGTTSQYQIVPQTLFLTYPFSESQSFLLKSELGEVVESDFFDKISMKGPGKTDNWMLRARFRIKIAPDGTVQVSLVRVNDGDQCKG
jgi:hypothetical protein